jgi:hypothetical protein
VYFQTVSNLIISPEEIFQLDGIDQIEETSVDHQQFQLNRPVLRRRQSSSPPRPPPPPASSFNNSIFASLQPKSLPALESAFQKQPLPPNSLDASAAASHDEEFTVELESEDEDDYVPLNDYVAPVDLGPSSLPIPTHKVGSAQQKEEELHIPEYGLASTAPTARTFQERAEELLRVSSKPDTRVRSQKSIRRKIYEEIDRQRHVDPGPDLIVEEGSDTDSDSTTHEAHFLSPSRH